MTDAIKAMIDRLKRRRRLFFFGIGLSGFLGLAIPAIMLGGSHVVGILDSAAFCTQVCHDVHYAEATTYDVSSHSEVPCADCHVGAGTGNLVRSKIAGLKDILPQLTHDYTLPIKTPLDDLRPSSETCEKCHYSEKFYGDIPQIKTAYASDELNTKSTVTHVLKVGGGLPEVASGIHWHSAAKIWYVAVDSDRKKIAWLASENVSGTTTEYVDPALIKQLTPQQIESQKRLMDCVDCHNRSPHDFQSPDQLIDKAIFDGSIDAALPFIKREALKALVPQNGSLDEANAKIDKLSDFYRTSYPQIHQSKKAAIDTAISRLREIAVQTTFPSVNWNTYSDNSRHDEPSQNLSVDWQKVSTLDNSAGCFRCHGNLQKVNGAGIESGADIAGLLTRVSGNITSSNATKTITPPLNSGNNTSANLTPPTTRPIGPLSANVTTASANRFAPASANSTADGGPGPGYLKADCNACHYTYQADITSPLAPATSHPIDGLDDCLVCHAPKAAKPFKSTHPWSTNEACGSCHQSAPKLSTIKISAKPADAKAIPHSVEKLSDCLVCHGPAAPNQMKKDHPWSTNDTCSACHDLAASLKPMPSPSAPSAKTIPHPIANLKECLNCHSPSSIKPIAADHPWATDVTCQACHPLSKTTLAISSSPLPTASAIAHAILGGFSCTSCHGPSGVAPFPSNHTGLPDTFCTICHRPGAVSATTPAPVPQGPQITHQLPGSFSCISCHKTGGPGPLPTTHTGVTDSFCLICHKQSAAAPTPTPTPTPTIDPVALYSTYCASCHAANRQGGIGPALTTTALAGLTTTQISTMTANGIGTMPGYSSQLTTAQMDALSNWLKSAASPTPTPTPTPAPTPTPTPTPPLIAHTTAGYAQCLVCHGYISLVLVPADHAGRTNSTCTTCHQTSGTPSPPVLSVGAPSLGHPLDTQHQDCLSCHGPGKRQPFPSSHTGYQNLTCMVCHRTSSR